MRYKPLVREDREKAAGISATAAETLIIDKMT